MNHSIKAGILCVLTILVMTANSMAQQTYTEDFTTNTYRHSSTTADWNNAEGKLKLFPYTPAIKGSVASIGTCRGIAIRGNIAYVAAGYTGLQVVDITDIDAPVWVGTQSTQGYSYEVDVAGDYAYIADWNSGLVVVDISNPVSPSTVATLPTPGSSLGIKVCGPYAYIGNGSGLMIVDISDPLNPFQVSTLATAGASARGLTVEGHYAYVPDGNAGLQIIDIGDPANPILISTLDTPGYAYDVTTAGNHAYLSDQSNGMVVVDISDPVNPVQVGHYSTTGNSRSLSYSGQHIYLANDFAGLDVIDVSDPSLPVLEHNIDTNGYAYDVIIHGNTALVADLSAGVTAIRLAEAIALEKVNTLDTINATSAMIVAGNHLFVRGGLDGITTYDLSSPESPVHVGGSDLVLNGLVVFGNYLLGFNNTGLVIVDISQPSAPVQVASLGGISSSSKAAVWGTKAIVMDNSELVVVDLSDPLQPSVGNPFPLGLGILDVRVEGNFAFIAHQYDGFVVVDISDPLNLQVVSAYALAGARTMAVSGNHVFVVAGSALVVLDITDHLSPTEAGQYTASSNINQVEISGNRAFILMGNLGLEVLDITNLAQPVSLSNFFHGLSNFKSVALHGDFTYCNRYPAYGNPGPREILVFQTSQRDADTLNNIGVSGNVDQGETTILQAIFSGNYFGTNVEKYELSADGGAHWELIPQYTSFFQFAYPGTNLRWRVTFGWGPGGSEVDGLHLDWFGPAGPLASIHDVPDDQGGRVMVDLKRSAYDHVSEIDNPVTQYGIYRRLADVNKAIDFGKSGNSDMPEEVAGLFPGYDSAWLDGNFFVAGSGDKSGFPDGTWVLLATIPALQSDHYFAEITTLADSSSAGTNSSDFVVTTHTTTPSVWYTSNIMSGYSVDNIAPGVPSSITALYQPDGVELDWDDSPENDLQFFRIYRSNQSGFVPSAENLLTETGLSNWSDETPEPWDYFYQVSAVDHAGNESPTGSVAGVTDVPEAEFTGGFALRNAVPNPFNPMTTIEYSLPNASLVQLKIYDMAGREVFTLVNDVQAAGVHRAQWMGHDNRGGKAASGMYLYRLKAGHNEEWKRMTLLK